MFHLQVERRRRLLAGEQEAVEVPVDQIEHERDLPVDLDLVRIAAELDALREGAAAFQSDGRDHRLREQRSGLEFFRGRGLEKAFDLVGTVLLGGLLHVGADGELRAGFLQHGGYLVQLLHLSIDKRIAGRFVGLVHVGSGVQRQPHGGGAFQHDGPDQRGLFVRVVVAGQRVVDVLHRAEVFPYLGGVVGEDGFIERERGFPGVRRLLRVFRGRGGVLRGFRLAFGLVRRQDPDRLVLLVRPHVLGEDGRLELDFLVGQHEFQVVDAVLFAEDLDGRLALETGQIAVRAAVEQKLDDGLRVAALGTRDDREVAGIGERGAGAFDGLFGVDLPRGVFLEIAELFVRELEIHDAAVADQDLEVFELGFGDRVKDERRIVIVQAFVQEPRRVGVVLQDAFQQIRCAAPDRAEHFPVGRVFGIRRKRDARPRGEAAEGRAVHGAAGGSLLGVQDARQDGERRAGKDGKTAEEKTSAHSRDSEKGL